MADYVEINVNGVRHRLDIRHKRTPLLWILRDELKLTGTKYGCGIAQCGACTVHINGLSRRSCVTEVGELTEDDKVITIEAADSTIAKAVKESWVQHQVAQCGYCQSGQIMSATALLSKNKNPTDDDIDRVMSGNLCRCGTYPLIRKAIKTAAKSLTEANNG